MSLDFQQLLARADQGDQNARLMLIQNCVCPDCGNAPLNLNWQSPGAGLEVIAACLFCGWTVSPRLRLRHIPQSLLARRNFFIRQAKAIKELVRLSILDGATVEPGPYLATVHSSEGAVCSQGALKAVLPADRFESLIRLLPRVIRQQVNVRLTQGCLPPRFTLLPPFTHVCEMRLADHVSTLPEFDGSDF